VLRLTPASTRPRPSVCARSAKIGPAEVDVLIGTPPSKRNVSPLVVAPIGTLATLAPSDPVTNAITEPFSAATEGRKWVPCARIDAGFEEVADPARKSGACPGPKMKSCEILSWRSCAGTATGTNMTAASDSERKGRICVLAT